VKREDKDDLVVHYSNNDKKDVLECIMEMLVESMKQVYEQLL